MGKSDGVGDGDDLQGSHEPACSQEHHRFRQGSVGESNECVARRAEARGAEAVGAKEGFGLGQQDWRTAGLR